MTLIRPAVRGIPGLAILALAWAFSGGAAGLQNLPATGPPGPGPRVVPQGMGARRPAEPRRRRARAALQRDVVRRLPQPRRHPGVRGPASKNVDIVTLVRGRAASMKIQLDEYHPGFRTSPSVLLHRFGTDPEYNILAGATDRRGRARRHGRARGSGRARTGPRADGAQGRPGGPESLQPVPRPRAEQVASRARSSWVRSRP